MKIPANTKHRKFPDNYKGQIRTHCTQKCLESCKNENIWEYFDKDSDDEEKEWYKDDTMMLTCEGYTK